MQTLHIQLLGDFRFLYNNNATPMAHLTRQQSLLAYLVLHRNAPQPRQHLAFLFWPDASEAQARANLRKVVYDLRKLLPSLDAFVQIEDQFLQWRNEIATILDVELFNTALKQAEETTQQEVAQRALEQATELYRGDLLPSCYDDWVLLARERLRQSYVKTLEQLIGLLEQRRDLASALSYAQRLLHCDPLHESTYRLLMRLHVLNGDRATALRIYHTCVTLLEQELGVEPSPETQQLYQRLLNAESAPPDSPLATPPAARGNLSLVGRHAEWEMLQSVWRAAVAGTAQCVLITGEAGIGKTRLVEELLQWADRQGYATARTRSYAAEGRLAYAPITDWLRSGAIRARLPEMEQVWLSELARLLPDLLVEQPGLPAPAPLAESWQRQRFREALARAILQGHEPLLLVLDDLQWCDSETLEWLHYLLRHSSHAPLLVVGTVRAEEIEGNRALTTLMIDLRQAGLLTDIELGPLNNSETTALAAQVSGYTLDPEQALSLYTLTEGHPLFVVETLRANEKLGMTSLQDVAPLSFSLPPKVKAVIQSRLAQLSPAARELAGLAATVGRAFTVEVVVQASRGNEDALVSGLDELWQRRLIREQGQDAYDFSHDRIREAAYASVSLARRRLLHRRVAEALELVYADNLDSFSGQLAAHYEQAGLMESAVIWHQRAAAVQRRLHAAKDAATYLSNAQALLAKLPDSPARTKQEISLLFTLSDDLMAAKGHTAQGRLQALSRARELLQKVGDKRQLFHVVERLHNYHRASRGVYVAREMTKDLLQIAQDLNDPLLQAIALRADGLTCRALGEFADAYTKLQEALVLYQRATTSVQPEMPFHHVEIAASLSNSALALCMLGYIDQARVLMTKAIVAAEKLASAFSLSNMLTLATHLYRITEESDKVQELGERLLLLGSQYELNMAIWSGTYCRGWVLSNQGAFAEGIPLLEQGIDGYRQIGFTMFQTYLLGTLADFYIQANQLDAAESALQEALVISATAHEQIWDAELQRLCGDLAQARGEPEETAAHCYLRAIEVARTQQAKTLELRATVSLARLWQKQGKRQLAQEWLATIYHWFTEGFTTPDLIKAKALLEDLS